MVWYRCFDLGVDGVVALKGENQESMGDTGALFDFQGN